MTENITDIKVSPNQLAELEPLSSLNAARPQELSGLCGHLSLSPGSTLFREGRNERGFKTHALRGGLQALPDDK